MPRIVSSHPLRGLLACCFSLTLTLALAVPGYADAGATHVQLILDASGSMYNQLDDGRYRLTAAKDTLAELVRRLPDQDLNVGLRVYGSKLQPSAAGACQDSELMVPMRGLEREALLETLRQTRARGKTPIAYSLEKALGDFPADAKSCLIVLVTDGEEVCGGDLKATAAKIEQAGCDMDLRIIGFDLTPEAAASFEGIGKFENAQDAAELADALNRAVDESVKIEPLGQASLEAVDEVEAGAPFEVTFTAEEGPGDYITIVTPDAEDGRYDNWTYTKKGNPVTLYAPVIEGDYELRYQSDRVKGVAARRKIRVVPAEIAIGGPPQIAGGQPIEIPWTGPNNDGDYITLVPADTPEGRYENWVYTKKGSPAQLHAPFEPGEYEFRYQSEREAGVVLARRPVTVMPTAVSLDAPSEHPAGVPLEVAWQGPDGKGDYLTIVEKSTKDGLYKSWKYTREGSPMVLQTPIEAGDYEIRYQSDREGGKVFARIPVVLTASEIVMNAPASVQAGTKFEVEWSGPDGASDYITIVPVDAKAGAYGKYRYTTSGSPITLPAPDEPGNYELRYQSDRVDGVFAKRAIRVE